MFKKARRIGCVFIVTVGAVLLACRAGEPRRNKIKSSAFVDADGDGICDNRNTCTNSGHLGKAQSPCQGSGHGPCMGKRKCKGNGQIRNSKRGKGNR